MRQIRQWQSIRQPGHHAFTIPMHRFFCRGFGRSAQINTVDQQHRAGAESEHEGHSNLASGRKLVHASCPSWQSAERGIGGMNALSPSREAGCHKTHSRTTPTVGPRRRDATGPPEPRQRQPAAAAKPPDRPRSTRIPAFDARPRQAAAHRRPRNRPARGVDTLLSVKPEPRRSRRFTAVPSPSPRSACHRARPRQGASRPLPSLLRSIRSARAARALAGVCARRLH